MRRRIYISNDSYPEMRNIRRGWQRHFAWWRAFRSGFRDKRLWMFFGVTLATALAAFGAAYLIGRWLAPENVELAPAAGFGAAAAVWIARTITVGGDIIRPHLRMTTALCGESCPNCGYHVKSQLAVANNEMIRCPECGVMTARSAFEPPFRIAEADFQRSDAASAAYNTGGPAS